MSEKTWTLKVNEDELRALIDFHRLNLGYDDTYSTEKSARIHDLTKRLNKKDEPEITEDKPQETATTQGW